MQMPGITLNGRKRPTAPINKAEDRKAQNDQCD